MDYRKLIEMLEKELRQFTNRSEISSNQLEMIEMITHSIKSAETIMAMRGNSGYSGTYYDGYRHYGDGMSHGNYSNGNGYSNARRDDGGYSSTGNGDMIMRLEELKRNAPEGMKYQFQKMIDEMRR